MYYLTDEGDILNIWELLAYKNSMDRQLQIIVQSLLLTQFRTAFEFVQAGHFKRRIFEIKADF